MANIFRAKSLISRTGTFSHEVTAPNLVYNTGTQTISGAKEFAIRPTVNGTGVLLSGEAAALPSTIVYTTGNQTISGNKIFANNLEIQGTGTFSNLDLSNISLFSFSGTTIEFINSIINSSGNIFISGNPVLTGIPDNLWASQTELDGLSGAFNITGTDLNNRITFLSGALNSSGVNLINNINSLSGAFNLTGSNLEDKINSLSGAVVLKYGDQNITGLKNFTTTPTVNTIPVLLSGEATDGLHVFAKNDDSITLLKGQPVYIHGANGANILIRAASNTGDSTSSKTLGLLNQDLAPNDQGYVITEGDLNNVDTSLAGSAGDAVWLGPTGNLIFGLANKPYAPDHLVYLGVVERKHATVGKIYVKVQNGFELEELHDVQINHAYSLNNDDILRYDTASGLWFNKPLNTGVFQTQINSLSGAAVLTYGNQTISGTKYFNDAVYANNLYVTGTEFIANVQNNFVQSPYLLLNLTGGAVDGGIFFVTGSGLTGLNDYGPIIGFDHSDQFKFGIGRRGYDISTLNTIASFADIQTYSGFVDNKYATITNLSTTGSTLQGNINTVSSNLGATGSDLQSNINTLTTNLANTGSTLDLKINNLSGQFNLTGSNLNNQIQFVSGALNNSGVNLINQINSLSGAFNLTGSNLSNRIVFVSGALNNSGVNIINSINSMSGAFNLTGSNLINLIDSLSGAVVLKYRDQSITGDKTFINKLIAKTGFFGQDNQWTGEWVSLGGGSGNLVSGDYSVIGGGQNNQAIFNYSTIVGGTNNYISSIRSSIGGGISNKIEGGAGSSNIGGGYANCITSSYSNIGGGYRNAAGGIDGCANVIGGGKYNIASGCYATVGGGYTNCANASFSNVVGGRNNYATSSYANIAGGRSNLVQAIDSNIAGGRNNCILTSDSHIGGGYNNCVANASFNFIGGGCKNQAITNSSVIGGGRINCTTVDYSTIGGGNNNKALNTASVIGAGISNSSAGIYSVIGGGLLNQGTGDYAVVGGGCRNCAGLNSSAILGGRLNVTSADYTVAVGGFCNCATSPYAAVLGGRQNCATASYANIAGGRQNRATGIYSFVGNGCQNFAGGDFSIVGNGWLNCSPSAYSTVGGGRSNCSLGDYTTVAGGRLNRSISEYSAIGGGCRNCINGAYSNVGGGRNNYILGQYSHIGGGQNQAFSGSYSNILGGSGNNGTGQFSTIAGGRSNFISGDYAFIGGGTSNDASGNYSVVVGGDSHNVFADYGYIVGGRCATVQFNHSGAAVLGDSQDRIHFSSGEHTLTLDFASGVYFAQPNIYGDIKFNNSIDLNNIDNLSLSGMDISITGSTVNVYGNILISGNPVLTGIPNGSWASQTELDGLSGAFNLTGSNLNNQIQFLTGALNSSGVNLNNYINALSGYINSTGSNIVFTTGNQIISGIKTFINDMNVSGTGTFAGLNLENINNLLLSGMNINITGNSIVNVFNPIRISGNQVLTGVTQDSRAVLTTTNQGIAGIKTFLNTGVFSDLLRANKIYGKDAIFDFFGSPINAENIVITGGFGSNGGLNADVYIAGGGSTNRIYLQNTTNLRGDLNITGGQVYISGNPVLTGVDLSSYATNTNLASTGSTLQTNINNLSGYINSTGSNIVFTTGNQTISGIKDFQSIPKVSGRDIYYQKDVHYFTGNNFTPDSNLARTFEYILTGAAGASATLNAPINMFDGENIVIKIKQSPSGSNNMQFSASYKFPGSVVPSLTFTAGKADIYTVLKVGTGFYSTYVKDFID